LRAYRFENGAIPLPAREAEPGPYRLRHGDDAVWPPQVRAYGGPVEQSTLERILEIGLASLRLAVPVFLLMTLLGATYLYADALLPAWLVPGPARGAMPTVSDLVLPFAWSVIHLTNRRYGAGHAFAQLLAALVLMGLVALVNPADFDNWIGSVPALSWRAMLAFTGAFLVANFVAIAFFDALRGPRWWSAPLAASAAASFVFSGLYYPAAFAGSRDWSADALVHFILFLAVSVLLLGPYYLLRPAMRPINGMNGY
jgi:uncharacterized PurR-regulated membrane protein YhhQ (DUF165 family)